MRKPCEGSKIVTFATPLSFSHTWRNWRGERKKSRGQIELAAGDRRLAAVAVRKIRDMSATAKALGIPIMMDFHPAKDAQSGLELTGIVWQESGTGDTYLSVAILFGVGVGNQGAGAGSMTDHAGCLIRTQ